MHRGTLAQLVMGQCLRAGKRHAAALQALHTSMIWLAEMPSAAVRLGEAASVCTSAMVRHAVVWWAVTRCACYTLLINIMTAALVVYPVGLSSFWSRVSDLFIQLH